MAKKIGCTKVIDPSTFPSYLADYFVAHDIVTELLKNGYLIIQTTETEQGKIKVFWEMECNQIA